MMKKRFLFLLLSALVYGGSAFADGETPEEETPTPPVTSLSIGDYGKLKDAVTSIKGAASLKETIKTLTEDLAASNRNEPVPQYEYETKTTSEVGDAIDAYRNALVDQTDPGDVEISYAIGTVTESVIKKDESGAPIIKEDENGIPMWNDETQDFVYETVETKIYTLYVTIPAIIEDESKLDESKKFGEWYSFKIKDAVTVKGGTGSKAPYMFYETNRASRKFIYPDYVVLIYRKGNEIKYTNSQSLSTVVPAKADRMYIFQSSVAEVIKTVSDNAKKNADYISETTVIKQEWDAAAGKYIDKETEAYKVWKKKNTEISTNLQNKETELGDYATITTLNITEDITVTDDKLSTETWPAGYTLNGNDKQLINNSGKALFGTNNGDISNWISLDQSIASTNKGYVTDCIVKYSGGYRIYDDHGTVTSFDELEDAIYSVRETYGMDLKNGKSTVRKEVTADTKLYQAQYANAANKDVYDFKVNIKTTGLGYDEDRAENGGFANGELTLDNAVVYIDNTDANTTLKNVAVKKGSTYVCTNAELTDAASSNEFYVPFAFTATNLTYDRTITTKYVSVCLPFALDAGKLKNMEAKAYTFDRVESSTKKMKFRPITTVAANTPCILAFSEAADKSLFAEALKGVTIASTADADLTSGDSFYGNYKAYQTAAELAGDKAGTYVYGVQKDKFVKMADNSHMNAFRSFVCLDVNLVQQSGTTNAPAFTISLLDEDGNEEVSGIELMSTTNNDTAAFKAVGGRNAIEITTGKACDVKVYTLNGALAKTARVEAGTTTLPMNAGMYVVNKTKVIVK